MRVLAVTHAYPRQAGDVAGAFLHRLYVALAARGHTVRVIAPADEGQIGAKDLDGIQVERVRYAAAHRETLAYRGTMEQTARTPAGAVTFRDLVVSLARGIRRWHADADIVHANWWLPAGLAARRARRRGAPPYVLTLHGTDAALLRRSRLARWIARPVLRHAAGVTAVSGFVADAARRAGAAAPLVMPMPADVARFDRKSRGGGGIVTVGRLNAQKRVHVAIELVAALHAARRPVALVIVGDGPERARLERLARQRGVEAHVRFLGARPPEEIPAALGDADLLVFPAREEGFGLAAAEALVAGVPVIALADGGGVLDLADTPDAVTVVPPENPVALLEAAMRILPSARARAEAARVGEAWRARLTPDAVAARLEETLESAWRNG